MKNYESGQISKQPQWEGKENYIEHIYMVSKCMYIEHIYMVYVVPSCSALSNLKVMYYADQQYMEFCTTKVHT